MQSYHPESQNNRTAVVDVLRGWALLSVVLMNYAVFYFANIKTPDFKLDHFTATLESIFDSLFEGKGWTLLAILFGFGFSVLLKKMEEAGQNIYSFFITRMLWLLLIAFFNSLFFGGDILNDYALMGILLLWFYKLNNKTLLLIAAFIILITPAIHAYINNLPMKNSEKYQKIWTELYDNNNIKDKISLNLYVRYVINNLNLVYTVVVHLIQLSFFLLGVTAQRSGFFTQMNGKYKPLLKKICWISCIFAIVIFVMQFIIKHNHYTFFKKYYSLYFPAVISIMVFTSSGICLLYHSGKLTRVFNDFRAIGKMTLTNYIIQNIISFIMFDCLKCDWAYYQYFIFAFVVYIIQIDFSKEWLKLYNYGPIEWLWRCLSYGKWVEIKKYPNPNLILKYDF